MAKRGRPAKVKPFVAPVTQVATAKPEELKNIVAAPPPPMTPAQLDSLSQAVKTKAEYLTNVNAIQSGMNGLTANGDLKFGNPLDGFTPEAIAQLKTMSTHELGSPKVAELFQEQTTPAQAPQIILPTSYNNTVQAAPQQAQTQQAPKIDVMDIFGIK